MSYKVLLFFGTRPEAIKLAPVLWELKKQGIQQKVCVSAQHREMLDQVLDFFDIKPDFDLDLMKPDQTLNSLSSVMLRQFDRVLEKEKPDLVLVQGDTTTAFVAALASFNRGIKVGHVEAGLRTYNKKAPFPEEGNRQLISRIADFHFAPTDRANKNLISEGILNSSILISGNTVVDALQWANKRFSEGFEAKGILGVKDQQERGKRLILVTGHRRENFGTGLEEICEALLEIAQRDDVQIVFPVHMNPKVKEVVYQKLASKENITLTVPVHYFTLLWLLKHCALVISDSGGIQEEAPSFNKPVLVTRNVTERMEGVEQGAAFLVGTDRRMIVEKTHQILGDPDTFLGIKNPYGDGKAASRIVKFILEETVKNS